MLLFALSFVFALNAPFSYVQLLASEEQAVYRLHHLTPNRSLVVRVDGDGKGDIDCYIIDPKGKIVAKDETNKDSCEIAAVPQSRDMTVWIVQHGEASVDYTVEVKQ